LQTPGLSPAPLKGDDDTEHRRKVLELLTQCSEDAFEVSDVERFTGRADKVISKHFMAEAWRQQVDA